MCLLQLPRGYNGGGQVPTGPTTGQGSPSGAAVRATQVRGLGRAEVATAGGGSPARRLRTERGQSTPQSSSKAVGRHDDAARGKKGRLAQGQSPGNSAAQVSLSHSPELAPL